MNVSNSISSDAQLIEAIASGDADAFEQLVQLHGGQMFTVARRFLRCEQDVNDAIQDALLSVFKNASRFEQNCKLSTWLHRITVNACLMKLRSQRRRHEVEIDELLPSFDETGHRREPGSSWPESPLGHVSRSEVQQRVRACINQLPDDYRTVLLLRDIDQVDTEEAADLLHCSTSCVKTRLHRARQALRTLLAPMMEA
ncbi:RNA polymerase sigma factor SigM [soil metagenome]